MYFLLNTYALPNQELNVTIDMQFDNEDISGETSSTGSVNKGIKAKQISVSFIIPENSPDVLKNLYRVAEAVDSSGNLLIYKVTNDLVNAAGVRQVIFDGRLSARQSQNSRIWVITCNFKEQISIPEKTEQRLDPSSPPLLSAGVQQVEAEPTFDFVQGYITRALNNEAP